MTSQDSQRSICSVPTEISECHDDDFIQELNAVDILYFCERTEDGLSWFDEENDVTEISNSSTNYESDNEEIIDMVEPSEEDTEEYLKQKVFASDTCGCKEFYGEPCSKVIDTDSAIEFREHCKEITREELDLIIKAELFAHRRTGSHTEAKKHKAKERERPYQEFLFTLKVKEYAEKHSVLFTTLKRKSFLQ